MNTYNNIYPVIDRENGVGIHSPLPYFPKENWRNKNRRPYSLEELENLMNETFDCGGFHPAKDVIALLEFEPGDHQVGVKHSINPMSHFWDMGQVVAMGDACFDKLTFDTGPTCTYNDYVAFENAHKKRIRFKRGKYMILIKDIHALGTIEDPVRFSNSAVMARKSSEG
jgi:hypothetical protein